MGNVVGPQLRAGIAEVLGAHWEPLAIVGARLLDRGCVIDDLLVQSGQCRAVGGLCPGRLGDQRAGAAHCLVVGGTLSWRLQATDQKCVCRGGIRAEQVGLDLLDPNELGGIGFGTTQREREIGEGQRTDETDDQAGHHNTQTEQPQPLRRVHLPLRGSLRFEAWRGGGGLR